MVSKICMWGVCVGCTLGLVSAAVAQNPATAAQNKLLAKRAAEADCFRKLAETIYGLQLTSSTYVRDFVTESDEIRTAVTEYVKGVRLGPPRYYDDGTCEVDAEVTVAKLITQLKEIHTAYYKGDIVHTTDFESIKQTVKSDVIRVTGAGAPRAEIPAGYEDAVEALPAGYTPPLSVPAIWKSVGPQARLMATRAAEVDAMRRLLERIKGLRLNSTTLVRDFVTESDEIRTYASGLVIGAVQVSKYLHRDELIVEVTMEVPVAKVFTKLKELHSAYYKGNIVHTTDIVKVEKTIKRKMIQETGSGVPPARFLAKARSAGVNMPAWMGERLSATGKGTDPNITTAQGKLKAARAAELDAKRRLAEEVYGLTIDSSTSVRDYVTEYDQIASQVRAVLQGAVVGDAQYSSDMATVTVTMPAATIWAVINQHSKIVERRG